VGSHVPGRSYLHSRGITYAVFCQGPYDESRRCRDVMGWTTRRGAGALDYGYALVDLTVFGRQE